MPCGIGAGSRRPACEFCDQNIAIAFWQRARRAVRIWGFSPTRRLKPLGLAHCTDLWLKPTANKHTGRIIEHSLFYLSLSRIRFRPLQC